VPDDHGLAHANKFHADPSLLSAGLGKEVAGSPVVVRAETIQQRVCAPKEGQAGPDPGQGGEADGLPVLPAGHALTGVDKNRLDDNSGATQATVVSTRPGTICSSAATSGRTSKPHCGRRSRGRRDRDGAWVTCWQTIDAVIDFLRNTYVGRAAPPVERVRFGGGSGGIRVGAVGRAFEGEEQAE